MVVMDQHRDVVARGALRLHQVAEEAFHPAGNRRIVFPDVQDAHRAELRHRLDLRPPLTQVRIVGAEADCVFDVRERFGLSLQSVVGEGAAVISRCLAALLHQAVENEAVNGTGVISNQCISNQ